MASLPIVARRDAGVNVEWFEPSRSPSEFHFVQPTSLYRYWLSSLRRHWLLTTAVSTVIMVCVIASLWLMSPQYRATAVVMIQPRMTAVVKIDPVLSPLPANLDAVTGELSVLRSRDLLLRLVAELHLDAYPEFDPNVPPFWKQTAQGVLEKVETWLPLLVARALTNLLVNKPLQGGSRMDAVVERVDGHLDTKIVGNRSNVISITFI